MHIIRNFIKNFILLVILVIMFHYISYCSDHNCHIILEMLCYESFYLNYIHQWPLKMTKSNFERSNIWTHAQ